MNKISVFSVAADSLFAAMCGFLLFFTAVRYYTSDAPLALACGIGAFISLGTLAFLCLKRKRGKRLISGRDEKLRQKLCLHLATLPKSEAAKVVLPMFPEGKIDGCGNIETQNCIYVTAFRCRPLTPDDIADELKIKREKPFELLCNSASAESAKLSESFCVKLRDGEEIYKKLKDIGALPESYPFTEKNKTSLLKRLSCAFRRSASPKLFWCGLCLLTFSFFTFFPLYYIISGGCILILSAACLIFGKRDKG